MTDMSDTLLLVFEILGTIAFAASGAMTGLSKKMDIFGVVTLGIVTSVGGGVIRDLVLGNTPPATFSNPIYALVATVVSIVLFIPAVRRFMLRNQRLYDKAMLVMDSVGLGIFTVVGIETAYLADKSNVFLLLFVGMVTGIGGGVLRDVLAGNTPYIFIKHFYASASLIGAVVCIGIWEFFERPGIAMLAGSLCILVLRFLAARFRWSLPKAEDIEKTNK